MKPRVTGYAGPMPELPEVETVRRTLEPAVLGQAVQEVKFGPHPVVRGDTSPTALMLGEPIALTRRHGKQLALLSPTGRTVLVHLGMSGSLRFHPYPDAGRSPQVQSNRQEPKPREPDWRKPDRHTHVTWCLPHGELRFRDPRRFGGLWTYPDPETLHAQRWSALGPDALEITEPELREALGTTRRNLKAALLDQSLIAGLGNIYVDEALFSAGLRPTWRADRIQRQEVRRLHRVIQPLLKDAIARRGTTLRDYTDASGQPGENAPTLRVYGRGGQPCLVCQTILKSTVLQQRTTVYCPQCQTR